MLAHSARRLVEGFNKTIWYGNFSGSEEAYDEQRLRRVVAYSNIETLLVKVGVGTLDQAVMAAIPLSSS
ncbi:hypothetical protein OR191_004398 [Enterobacter hormaechei]|nr:hypothetical protein [Enterobacter hormaechei]